MCSEAPWRIEAILTVGSVLCKRAPTSVRPLDPNGAYAPSGIVCLSHHLEVHKLSCELFTPIIYIINRSEAPRVIYLHVSLSPFHLAFEAPRRALKHQLNKFSGQAENSFVIVGRVDSSVPRSSSAIDILPRLASSAARSSSSHVSLSGSHSLPAHDSHLK